MNRILGAVVIAAALLCPVSALAQQTGAIAGVVRDTSGAVLPGVTVEASSPALIEKVRVVTTDGNGAYRITDLQPGVYATTFSLTGFATVKREGIELTAGFTANINGELRVGAVAETITVSGATPLVDVQNVLQQRVMTREVLDTIPTGKQYTAFAQLVPGLTPSAPGGPINQDVGGMTGMTMTNLEIHGGDEGDGTIRVNGMSVASITSQGNSRTNLPDGNVEEYQMQLAAQPAEFPYGGVYMNVIPKQGGNTYHGAIFAGGTSRRFQADNLGELRARGLAFPSLVKRIVDINPSFGGPIAKDRLWFYIMARQFITDDYVPGLYTNQDVTSWIYRPTNIQAITDQHGKNGSLNLTFQATPKNKVTFFYDYDFQCYCHYTLNALFSPEAAYRMNSRNHLYQGTWSSPVTNHLLFETSFSRYIEELPRDIMPARSFGGPALYPSILIQSTGFRFRAFTDNVRNNGIIDHYRASVSYVTAAHALKVGVEDEHQWADDIDHNLGSIAFRVLNNDGVPNQVTYYTLPYAWQGTTNPWAIYGQDQWTLHRVTINAGLRYDFFGAGHPAEHVDPTPYLPVARDYPAAKVLNWKDLDPRLGVSWDLFGNGKTAVKASVSRFIMQEGKTTNNSVNPVLAATNSISRAWTPTADELARIRAGDPTVTPGGDPLNPAANGDLGPSPNNNFGKPITTTHLDPAWASGYGKRPFDWETSAGVQREITPRVSMTAMYYRRIYGNFIVTQNTLVSPADYDRYCIMAPIDPRLPNGGGQQICGLYDLNPSKVGLVDNVKTYSGKFGSQYKRWNGVDVTMNARFPNSFVVQGGWSSGKLMTDNCQVVPKIGSPSAIGNPSTYNCHQESPWLNQWKFLSSYPLPWWGIQVSGSFQRMVYDPTGTFRADTAGVTGFAANYVASSALIAPSLGRPLSGGAPNATINLLQYHPGLYFDPLNQVDLRTAKTFTVGRRKIQGQFDAYNLFNANTVLSLNPSYGTNGASWETPTASLPGRLIRFGLQVNF